MDIFDLSIEKFEKEVDKILKNIDKDNLFNELIECGLEVEEEK